MVGEWIERKLELAEKAEDKLSFLEFCLEQCGGIQFSKNTIKVGYHVRLHEGWEAEVISAGSKNIAYQILTEGAKGMVLKAAYAEITEIIQASERTETHPFTVGERFTAEQYIRERDSLKWSCVHVTYEIVKSSSKTIQLKPIDKEGKIIICKPRKSYNDQWCFSIDNACDNTFYKTVPTSCG